VNVLVALVVIAVAAATFVFSYDGVHAIALLGGMSVQLARYYPGLFDAVLVIACVAAVVLRDGRWWARAWAWVVLVVVLAAIGATDVLHAMNYSLRHRPTEGVVAAAPVVAVLLAFSLLLALLRQPRSQGAVAPAADEPAEWAARRPAMPAPLDLPALPAAVPAADAATVETPVVTAGPALRPPAPPIALPAGPETTPPAPPDGPESTQLTPPAGPETTPPTPPADPETTPPTPPADPEAGPLTPPDGLPAMTRPATEPNETLPPAAPPVASQRAPEGEPAPPTVSSPAVAPPLVPSAPAEPGPARPHGIRYAGSGGPVRSAGEPATAGPAAEPDAVAAEPDGPHEDYWDGDDAGQFAGLVYPAREGGAGSDSGDVTGAAGDADEHAADEHAAGEHAAGEHAAGEHAAGEHAAGDDDGAEAGGPAPGTETREIDEDAPPFATAPFATVPRLNRVRSMPVPPEEDE
jgi:hypothetical protein